MKSTEFIRQLMETVNQFSKPADNELDNAQDNTTDNTADNTIDNAVDNEPEYSQVELDKHLKPGGEFNKAIDVIGLGTPIGAGLFSENVVVWGELEYEEWERAQTEEEQDILMYLNSAYGHENTEELEAYYEYVDNLDQLERSQAFVIALVNAVPMFKKPMQMPHIFFFYALPRENRAYFSHGGLNALLNSGMVTQHQMPLLTKIQQAGENYVSVVRANGKKGRYSGEGQNAFNALTSLLKIPR